MAAIWVTATDLTIALPTIGREMGDYSADRFQWAVNGFFLAGALVVVTGRLGDLYGRRLLFSTGMLVFAAGSVVGALSWSPDALIAGRVLQGAGAAAVLPNSLAMISAEFPDSGRNTAIGAWMMTGWLSQAIGPLVGGGMVQAFGWPAIFWLCLPLAGLAVAIVRSSTPESTVASGTGRVDVSGAILLVSALALVNYGLVVSDAAPVSEVLAAFLAAAGFLAIFLLVESRVSDPLVRLSIFTRRAFDGAVVGNLLANFVFSAVVFFMSLYLQVVLGFDPLKAGALLLPATIPVLVAIPAGAVLGRRFGPVLPISLSLVVLAISTTLLATLGPGYAPLVAPFLLLGVGVGLQGTMTARVAVDDSGDAGEGVASGIYKTSSMVGGAMGVAVLLAVFQGSAAPRLRELLPTATPEQLLALQDVISGARSPDTVTFPGQLELRGITDSVFSLALGNAMWVATGLCVLAAVACLALLRGYRLRD